MPAKDKRRWAPWLQPLLVLAVLAGVTLYAGWYHLFRTEPQHFDSPEEHFKYGSIGNEETEGMPYYIWLVLPRMFPEYLPPGQGGYASLGIIWEPGHETPVGFSKKTIGFPRLAINCAFCHTGTYRTAPDKLPTIVPTAPSTRLDLQKYQRFLAACAADPRFTADNILAEIGYHFDLSWADQQLYRHVIIPRTRKGILDSSARFAWTENRPDWGRGRIDPFNPVKFHQLGMDANQDPSIGNSDMEPLWNMGQRDKFWLHWDGLNTSLTEVVHSGAIGDGATARSLPVQELKGLQEWLRTLPPPVYPFPIDRALAAAGEPIFKQHCAACHAFGGERTGTIIPLMEVGTDPHRLGMWSQEAADRYNRYAADAPWGGFKHFVRGNGYVAVALDGVWLRAPYLHNGSVPTLRHLLEPVADRPRLFYRGYDVYDPQQVGFIYEGAAAERAGFRYDTSVAGNGNGGHEGETFGTTLSAAQKRALVEYLKTQ